MKKSNASVQTELNCKATASLKTAIQKDLQKEDRPIKELLDEKERKGGIQR
jgi:hypothetical protein